MTKQNCRIRQKDWNQMDALEKNIRMELAGFKVRFPFPNFNHVPKGYLMLS